jgi:hypothetical protein
MSRPDSHIVRVRQFDNNDILLDTMTVFIIEDGDTFVAHNR